MSKLTDSIVYTKTPNGSVGFQVKIVLDPSGMAHLHTDSGSWPMGTDAQVARNLEEAIAVGRSKV